MILEYGAYSHKGNVRKLNEDYFYIPEHNAKCDRLVMVADGMGGHKAGDLASQMVVETILDFYRTHSTEFTSHANIEALIREAIFQANLKVFSYSKMDGAYSGMGTTLTLSYFFEQQAFLGHVGDSRGYLVRDGQVRQVTRDHSLVQELLDNGTITREEVENHPQKNIITRALGTEQAVDIDYYQVLLKENDILILCTDGLTNHVDLNKNAPLFMSGCSMEELASILGQEALMGGGIDNITIIATKYSGMAEKR